MPIRPPREPLIPPYGVNTCELCGRLTRCRQVVCRRPTVCAARCGVVLAICPWCDDDAGAMDRLRTGHDKRMHEKGAYRPPKGPRAA